MFKIVQSYHLEYWETVSSFSESEHCILVNSCVFLYHNKLVKLYTLCSVFMHRDLKVGPDIESKFHRGSDGNCQSVMVKRVTSILTITYEISWLRVV